MTGEMEAFDPVSKRIINKEESNTLDALNSFTSFRFDMPRHLLSPASQQNKRTRYNNFAFDAGSAKTSGSLNNKSVSFDSQVDQIHRFPAAYANVHGVPGPSSQGTGEKT